ncbi:hypothetical protein JOQ06_004169 [Pogonophryne albipinna]|uniref:Uncharacterized protein n=1 Tax=Pogonophryne albipinna TaxID=1090488 RepID=A0AAD6A4S1_9TELE|nr:hypothetical protein JOQ06_004169 [Pogonophryne albipinna]
MRAGVLWMLMVCLSDGKDPTCSVLTSLTVSKLTKVNVSCPSTTRRETNYQLFFNGSSFGRIHMKKESGSADMLFSGQFEVTANSSGEFLCRSEESWPPPNTDDCHTTEVTVAELQSLPEINGSAPAANQSCPFRSPLIPEENKQPVKAAASLYRQSISSQFPVAAQSFLLSLCLPAWSAVKVVQPYKVVSSNGTALVQCFLHPQPFHHQSPLPNNDLSYPFPEPEDLRVTLLRGLHGSTKICSSILNLTGPIETGEEGEVQCSAQRREGALELTVSGLRATDTDLYRCDIEIFYPPPYLRFTGNGTLIHILGSSDFIMYLQASQCDRGRREIIRPVHTVDAAVFSCYNLA